MYFRETRPSAQQLFFDGVNDKLSLQQEEETTTTTEETTTTTEEPESDAVVETTPETETTEEDQSVPEQDEEVETTTVEPETTEDGEEVAADDQEQPDEEVGEEYGNEYGNEYGDEEGFQGEEDFGEWDDQEVPEGQEGEQDWEDVEGDEWRQEDRKEEWHPEGPRRREGGDRRFQEWAPHGDFDIPEPSGDQGESLPPREVDPVSLVTRDEAAETVRTASGDLTDEAKAIVSSVKDKIQGNKALALSIIHELTSLQWGGAGAGAGAGDYAGAGNEWMEKFTGAGKKGGASDWAS
ncbi:MAG: hypothetical protein ACMG6E_09050 [Candidatus Roizmanbacteria bacterium]